MGEHISQFALESRILARRVVRSLQLVDRRNERLWHVPTTEYAEPIRL
jgi:hypothetical protein